MANLTLPETKRGTVLTNTCYHCGEPCQDETVLFQEKSFCCQGCKMVFQILDENNLCTYYDIDENAGISLKGRRQEHYAFLDDPKVAERLLDYADEEKVKISFHLPQIHCASCIWLLENLYKLNDGISYSKVNFPKKEISLIFLKDTTSLRKIVELLASLGYAPAINLQSLEKESAHGPKRSFYYKLGLAGFAFGNIMLLSFPEYLGLEADSGDFFQKVFGYLNITLALPVLLYSGRDYFVSAWGSLRHGFLNLDVPIALGMIALFARSVFEILSQTGAGYMDSFSGLVFFLLIGKWFQQRTYHHLSFERNYKSYFPIATEARRNGIFESVSLDQLQENDTIRLRHGELIPADGVLLKGLARIDYSFVTGESEPQNKSIGDKLFAGGRQMGEPIEISLTKKVSQSYLTQLWNDEAFSQAERSSTSKLADLIGKRFTAVVMTIAFATLFYWYAVDPSLAWNAFTAVLIIACPCAVALSIPFTLGNIIRIFAKKGLYLKNTQVVEDLNDIGTMVFDKTGTLTNTLESKVLSVGPALSSGHKKIIRSLAVLSNHPLSRLISDYLEDGTENFDVKKFEEITGKGIQATIDGNLIKLGSGDWIMDKQPIPENYQKAGVLVSVNGVLITGFAFQNSYREGMQELLGNFESRYQLYLLSGDNDQEKARFQTLFHQPDALHFNQSPQDKLNFIGRLKAHGQKVLMFGDGLNDAGALQKSDVGIVITENTANFTPASDGILQASHFKDFPRYFKLAHKSIQIVHWSYFLAFGYNLVGLSFAVTGTLSPVVAAILMPASSVTIVLFGVGMSSWMANIIFNGPSQNVE